MSVSGSTHAEVWPEVCDWFHDVSERDEDEGADAAADESVSEIQEEAAAQIEVESPGEDDDAADVESVDGIGPTYAERLHEAGIETTADLADADAETVAEAAQTSESNAADWIEQVE
jgi:polyhydroxyalkanoate synthase